MTLQHDIERFKLDVMRDFHTGQNNLSILEFEALMARFDKAIALAQPCSCCKEEGRELQLTEYGHLCYYCSDIAQLEVQYNKQG
jgi:hypothetical protein